MGGISSKPKKKKQHGQQGGRPIASSAIEVPNFVRPSQASSTFAFTHELVDVNELGKSLFQDCYPFSVLFYDTWLQIQQHTSILNLVCSKSMYQLVWAVVCRFSFAKKSISDNTTMGFVSRTKKVYLLDLVDCIEITDTLFEEHLCNHATLISLNLSGCIQLSDDIFTAFLSLPNLRTLNISEVPRISAEEGVRALAKLTTLRDLTMGSAESYSATRWVAPPFEEFGDHLQSLTIVQSTLLEVIKQTRWYQTHDHIVTSQVKTRYGYKQF